MTVILQHGSPDLESFCINCKPFYTVNDSRLHANNLNEFYCCFEKQLECPGHPLPTLEGRLQRIFHTAEKVIGCNLPSLKDLHISRTLRRAGKILSDSSQPGHSLFQPLPSSRRLWSVRTKTSRHKNSFFPSAAGLFNKAKDSY